MPDLILSGWTQPSDALSMLAPDAMTFDYSDYDSPAASFEALKKLKPAASVIAWSMGGQLALRAIITGVIRPKHLTLIATPCQFVTGNGIKGMDPLTFEQFRTNYAENPARTKTRFHALVAKGDRDQERILKNLQHHPQVEDTKRWLPWLDDLGRESLAGGDFSLVPPTLIVHGDHDAIVDVGQGEWLAHHLPTAEYQCWPQACHAPHLHDADRLQAAIKHHRTAVRVAA